MKIEFELTEKQAAVLKELLAMPVNQDKTENEACRIFVVQTLINTKQQLIAAELSR